MTSPLVFQWLFIRLSRRFSVTFLVALGAYLCWIFPIPYEWIVPLIEGWRPVGFVGQAWKALNLPTVLTGLVVVALAAIGFFLALWAATTVYRLAPARPARWHRPAAARGGRVEPSPPALPLGSYDRIGIILAGGGAKGAYQAGALDALHRFLSEREALGSVRMIAATSIGAWNACFWLALDRKSTRLNSSHSSPSRMPSSA